MCSQRKDEGVSNRLHSTDTTPQFPLTYSTKLEHAVKVYGTQAQDFTYSPPKYMTVKFYGSHAPHFTYSANRKKYVGDSTDNTHWISLTLTKIEVKWNISTYVPYAPGFSLSPPPIDDRITFSFLLIQCISVKCDVIKQASQAFHIQIEITACSRVFV